MILQITQTEDGYLFTAGLNEQIGNDGEHIFHALHLLANALQAKEQGDLFDYASALHSAGNMLISAGNCADADYAEEQRLAPRPKTKRLFAEVEGMGYLARLVREEMDEYEKTADVPSRERHAEALYKQIVKIKDEYQIKTPVNKKSETWRSIRDLKSLIFDLLSSRMTVEERDAKASCVLFELLSNSKVFLKKAGEGIERD